MTPMQLQHRIAQMHAINERLNLMCRDMKATNPHHPQIAAWEAAKVGNDAQIMRYAQAFAEKMEPSEFDAAGQWGHPLKRRDHSQRAHAQEQMRKHPASQWGYRPARRVDVNPQRGITRYGHVQFADQVNDKYPIDTPEHIRAAWSYIHQIRNENKYSRWDVHNIEQRIIRAWKQQIDPRGPPEAR